MVASPRWKRHDGKDFVFYDPHPGLVSGPAGKQYWSYVCNVSALLSDLTSGCVSFKCSSQAPGSLQPQLLAVIGAICKE
jgi:hypothetical protein